MPRFPRAPPAALRPPRTRPRKTTGIITRTTDKSSPATVTAQLFIDMLLLLLAANGAPVLGHFFFGRRGDLPLDGGRMLRDGHPLFGTSKTWRGLLLGIVTCGAAAMALGYGLRFGLVFGALSMAGDLLSSFTKRRLGLESGARSTALDQLPEALLPAVFAALALPLHWWWPPLLAFAFMLADMVISLPLYWLRIRRNPY